MQPYPSQTPKKPQPEPYDYTMKTIIIGDSGVGKSSLLIRYRQNKFINNYLMTIGINCVWNILEVEGVRIKLQIWDTAGQEKYKTITQNYYRNSNGVIIAFSIDARDTFYSVRHWIDELTQTVKQNTQIILIGTKSDMSQSRQVSRQEAEQFARQHQIPYIECSAKSGESVELVFRTLGKMMKGKFIDQRLKEEEDGGNGNGTGGSGGTGTGGKEEKNGKVIHIMRYGKDMRDKCCQN